MSTRSKCECLLDGITTKPALGVLQWPTCEARQEVIRNAVREAIGARSSLTDEIPNAKDERLVVSGGPATNQFFSVDFDHTKLVGSAYLQGIQNLVNWTTSSNVTITSGPTLFIDATHLKATLTVDPTATLGPRAITVTNPDQLSGTLAAALTVVRTPDLNGNCVVDGSDLNTLARSWAMTSADSSFRPQWDLNGDGAVDGNDLVVFVQFFGHRLPGCP